MRSSCSPVLARCVLGALFCTAFGLDASGASIWRATTSGLWRDSTNWSSPTAPSLATGGAFITNLTTKTVAVDAPTPVANLFVNGLNVWAPASTTNTLRLADVGTNSPLVVSNGTLTVARGGLIEVTNSSLVVTGRFINFNVWAGGVTLDSGSIIAREEPFTTNVTVVTRIGRTNAATLTINGGFMQTTELQVGESPGLQFGRSRGTVRMSGGLLKVTGELSVGNSASCTGSVEITGGQLLVPNNLTNITRIGDEGTGTMTVSNAAVLLGDTSVARHDRSVGTLVLLPGGFLGGSDDLSIGRFSGATGTVLVAGGQLIVTNHPIWVGREGAGQLIVSNGLVQADACQVAVIATNTARGSVTLAGGTTLLSSRFLIGAESLATGQVSMAAGSLLVTNADGTAYLAAAAGTMTVAGGSVTADNLIVTNANGRFALNGGSLHSKSTAVSNGAPFVVGDGTSEASFELLGGTHVFAHGLVISSNATLRGCGTIVGSVTIHGTDLRNCGTTPAPPAITQQPASLTVTQGATVTFSVTATGDAPLRYQWRFGTPGQGGGDVPGATGSTFTVNDAQPTNAGNYRVSISNSAGVATSAVATLRVLVEARIASSARSGAGFSLSLASVNALSYVLEFKDSLDLPSWTPLGTLPGTGGTLTFNDPAAGGLSRFYRVRVE